MKSALLRLLFVALSILGTSLSIMGQLYTVEVTGVERLDITDSHGNTSKQISGAAYTTVPGVTYEFGSAPNNKFVSPHTVSFLTTATMDITFRTSTDPAMEIRITNGKGKGQGPYTTLLIRYLDFADLHIPPNINAWLHFMPQGVSDLKLDRDNDGTFESSIKPQYQLTGAAATDVKEPGIWIDSEVDGNVAIITLRATDTESGVKTIQYQVGDGSPVHPTYSRPFKVDISKPTVVFAIATDMAGNRSFAMKAFGEKTKKADSDPFKLKSIPY